MEYPEKITGFRSKVINGIIEAGKASRPVAGNGIHVSESSAGSAISLAPGFSAARPFPFMARLVRAMKDGETVAAIQIWLGRVLLSGGAAAEFDAEGSELEPRDDPVSGLSCVEIPAEDVSAVWINVYPDDDPPRYTLGTEADEEAAAALKVAEIAAGGNAVQRLAGDISLPVAAEHWGETRPLVELPADEDGEWEAVKDGGEATAVAESHLVDIDVDSDGKVKARRYRTTTIDANGNVVAISDRSEGAAPDSPDEPPECGHPLNEDDDDWHPFDDWEPGSQHGHYGPEGPGAGWLNPDGHPLDEEGDGGFTPKCNEGKE